MAIVAGLLGLVFALAALSQVDSGGKTEAAPQVAGSSAAPPRLSPPRKVLSSRRFVPSIRLCRLFRPARSRSSTVEVLQHVTQVVILLSHRRRLWSFAVNGTAVSRNRKPARRSSSTEGDRGRGHVRQRRLNKKMNVNMPHSIDFHSAEVAPKK